MYTHSSVPILVIKTKLFTKKIQTEMIAFSMDVIIHKPLPPIEVDLSEYDWLRFVKPESIPNWLDAVIFNVGVDYTVQGGVGFSFQIILILKGKDRGLYVYKPTRPNVNVGLSISVGASVGIIDFNEQNAYNIPISAAAFEGKSQGWSGGWEYGGGISTAYADGQSHDENIWGLDAWGVEKKDVLYRAYMGTGPRLSAGSYISAPLIPLSTGLRFGFQYSFTESELFEWGSFPFNQ